VKIDITLTDDKGNTYSGTAELTSMGDKSPRKGRSSARSASSAVSRSPSISFSGNERGYIRRHVTAATSGQQKFVILLAWLTKGDPKAKIATHDLEKAWARLKGPLGGEYRSTYATRAKDGDWADSPEKGQHCLLPNWKEAFAS
jgi:hypothetical protein